MEPQLIDYYNDLPYGINVIERMNSEYDKLENENKKLKEELSFLNKIFEYPLHNSMVYHLVRVKKDGEDIWINRIKISEEELKECDKCNVVEGLLKECNPRCER